MIFSLYFIKFTMLTYSFFTGNFRVTISSILNKYILKLTKRFQRILLFLQKYNLKCKFKKGIEPGLFDKQTRDVKLPLCFQYAQNSWEVDLGTRESGHALERSECQLWEIRSQTRNDVELLEVEKLILTDWSDNRNEVSDTSKPYSTLIGALEKVSDCVSDVTRITRVTLVDEHRYSVIGKHYKDQHQSKPCDILGQFSILKKCRGKLDCLLYEMLFIRTIKPTLNTQGDSVKAKLFIFQN